MLRLVLLVVVFCGYGAAGCGAAAPKVGFIGDPDRHWTLMELAEVDADELEGEATWYGERHHGRTTASGEPFDMYEFTCAHRTLPFDSLVRVTRLDTRQSVVVRVNDRGPWSDGRVVDLSWAAAEQIDLIRPGHTAVQIELLAVP